MTAPSPAQSLPPRGVALRGLFDRHNLPLVGVFVLLVLLLLATGLRRTETEPVPFDPDSTAAGGLRGLVRWLTVMGYDVRRTQGLTFDLPQEADLLFVYPNQLSYAPDEATHLRAWVEAGNTLVIVGPAPEDRELEATFGVRAVDTASYIATQQQVQPLLPEGQEAYPGGIYAAAIELDLEAAPAAVPMLTTAGDQVLAAVQPLGAGVVWHLSPNNGLVNDDLQYNGHGQLLIPILRTVPPGGVVVFDTYHQFGLSRLGERIVTLQDWLYRTPTGWAALFGLAAGGLFVLLQGRRLGPAVPSAEERKRREAAEYVEAMAGLARRARLGADVARHHKERLKRGLARRRPFSAALPDDEFLARLGASEPALPAEQVAQVQATLRALDGPLGEQQLVETAAQVDAILAKA